MALKTVDVPFGEWTPDAPELKSGCTVATGVIPSEGAYRPIPDVSTIATATLSARAQGGQSFYDADGNVIVFAGDVSKLYQLDGSAFTDRSGTTYACPADAVWQFAQYGQKIVAVNPTDNVQVFDMASPGNFSNLAGSPPKARHVARIRDFLVLGDIQSSPIAPSRVQWCAIGDIVTWSGTATNQADSQDLSEDGGRVQGIFNLFDAGLIIQERTITRMTYEGLPTIFSFDVVEQNQGATIGRQGMLQNGSDIFYISDDGPSMWSGQRSEPIADKKVSRFFLNDLNFAYRHNTFAVYDYVNRAVWWAYPGGSSQVPDSLLIFSLKDNRWSYDTGLELEMIFTIPKRGITLEDLDAINTNIDLLPLSLDSAVYQSDAIRVGGFNTSHVLAEFTGSNRRAILETAEFQPEPGQRFMVNEIWPIVDDDNASTVTAQLGYRLQKPGDALTYTNAAARNARGKCSLRAQGRNMRARVTIPAGNSWTHAEGVQAGVRILGRR